MRAKVALVTGASSGLGKVIAHFLAGQGYSLVIDARGGERLEREAGRLRALGAEVRSIPGDVSHPAHRQALLEAARALGGLSALVNNASSLGPTPLPALADYPLDALRGVFEVNVLSPLALVQEALPLLVTDRGLVVNISSDAAQGGYPGWGGYGLTKAALDLATRNLANELREQGVACVAVDPGDMRTEMHQAAFPGEDISDRPLPDVTLPFWAWLLGQDPLRISGRRFKAQAESWGVTDAD